MTEVRIRNFLQRAYIKELGTIIPLVDYLDPLYGMNSYFNLSIVIKIPSTVYTCNCLVNFNVHVTPGKGVLFSRTYHLSMGGTFC